MMKAPRPQHVAAREKVVILALRWAARSIGTGRIVCFGTPARRLEALARHARFADEKVSFERWELGRSAFAVHVFRHPAIYPQKIREQNGGRHQKHPAHPKSGGDRAAGKRPNRIAEKHCRGGNAVDRPALRSRYKPPDKSIGRREDTADEQPDGENAGR